jgi:type 1 glutamine amidotransferase
MFRSLLAILALASTLFAADAKIVLIAGKPSHPPGMHEYNAGMILLDKCLRQNPGVAPVVVKGGWPEDESVFDGARAVVVFMDGGARHAVLEHMDTMAALMRKGVGMGAIHYGVDVPKETGGPKFLDWLGGYYEKDYSKNPVNDVIVQRAADRHPISTGWDTYSLKDEWYYRIRFRDGDPRVTPILTVMLPKESPQKEVVAWATRRDDGGRAFGFTGGHFHSNWGKLEQRRVVLNALLWIAKVPIPKGGAKAEISVDDLTANLDDKPQPPPRKKK